MRFSEENAVSVAEKYADMMIQNTIISSDKLSFSIEMKSFLFWHRKKARPLPVPRAQLCLFL